MEAGAAVGSEMGAVRATGSSTVRWRWVGLVAAVIVAFGAAFAIGSVTKKTSAPPAATSTNLAPAVAGAPAQTAVTGLSGNVAVPKLRVPPPAKHKTKTSSSPTSTATSPTQSTSASSLSTTVQQTVQQPQQTVQQTQTQQQQQTTTHGGGGGVSHGGA